MKRKLLSILLTLAMMLTLLPATAMAEGNETVAKIGDVGYETLEAAIKDAADNATITLERSIEVSSAISIGKTLTIDLNGFDITGKNGEAGCRVFQVIGGGNLTLTGNGKISTAEKNDTDFTDSSSVIRVGDNTADKDAELTVDSGVQVCAPASYGIAVFGKNRTEKLTVKGKVLATAGAAAVSGNGSSGFCATEISIEDNAVISSTGDVAIYHPQDGKLTVKNATVKGTSGIECKSGNTTIDVQNAVVEATTAEKSHQKNSNGTSTKGYAIAVVDNAAYKGGATVTVSGGRYTGSVAVVKDDEDVANPGSITITGGTFSQDPSAYVPAGYKVGQNANGIYTVRSANTGGSGGGGGGSTGAPASGTTQKETKPEGTVTETTIDKDGTKTVKATDPNGSVGTTTTKKDANGNPEVNADVKISEKAIEDAKKKDEPVRAPIEVEAGKDSNSAPTVKIELPKNAGETEVLVPVSNANSGTVAVLVHPDGTEEIIKDSVPVEEGIQFGLNGSATVKILDNSKDFIDTVNHWSKDDVNFVVSRELFNGVGGNLFGVSGEMTRGMVNTVLARLAGVDTNGGVNWYDKGNEWAMKNSISDGTNPMTAVTREQLATLLWRFAGAPVVDGALGFSDADEVSDYAQVAVLWATQNSIISGVGNNRVAPAASAERAQVAAMLARYLKNIA